MSITFILLFIKQIKQTEIEEVKLSLYADEVILYMENPKDSTQKLLELTDEFSKVSGYKINIQKLAAFLYINNEISERESKKTIPFKTVSNKKYLEISLTIHCKKL